MLCEEFTSLGLQHQFLALVKIFYLSDEHRKCAENSDIRFYLVKSLIRYQKVKIFGIYLRLEEFDHKSLQKTTKNSSVTYIFSIEPHPKINFEKRAPGSILKKEPQGCFDIDANTSKLYVFKSWNILLSSIYPLSG